MIEIHNDFIAPWWIVPLFTVGIAVMVGLIYALSRLVDRWFDR